jgi:hypothetical protein
MAGSPVPNQEAARCAGSSTSPAASPITAAALRRPTDSPWLPLTALLALPWCGLAVAGAVEPPAFVDARSRKSFLGSATYYGARLTC